MHIEKIDIENFKSFKLKTSITFSPITTIIVGKNGSGKSNIIQAIQFVICCEKLSKQERIEIIHEGNEITENKTEVKIYINNSKLRLDGPKIYTIKRIVSVEKDEYFVNDKLMTMSNVINILNNSGICTSVPYFIVKQNKINYFINLNNSERYNLIKNISGALKYEIERENCIETLNNCKITQKSIDLNLQIINDKLKNLEKEKEKIEESEKLENEKRRYEIAYLQKDLIEINNLLKNEVQEEFMFDIESEIKLVSEKIKDLERKKHEAELISFEFFDKENENIDNSLKSNSFKKMDLQYYKNELKLISEELNNKNQNLKKFDEKLKNYQEKEKEISTERFYLKNIVNFLKIYKDKKLTEDEKKKEISIIKNVLEEKKASEKICFDYDMLTKLIDKRKELWREEKRLMENKKSINEAFKMAENKLFVSGHFSYNVYKEIKDQEGVIGCVYNLIDIPEDFMSAFEAVSGGFLFNIVVENEQVVNKILEKDLSGNAIFIPLNKLEEKNEIEIEGLESLSSKIICDNKYKKLVQFITRNTFLTSDLKKGSEISKKYKISVVTKDGDLITKSGVMTGGYEHKSTVIIEYKKSINELEHCNNNLKKVQNKISKLNIEIETINNLQKENINLDGRVSTIKFLEEKIKILESSKYNLKSFESKLENFNLKNIGLRTEIIKTENEYDNLKSEVNKLEKSKTNIKNILNSVENFDMEWKNLKNQLDNLKIKEVNKLTCNSGKSNLFKKKEELEKKIANFQCENLYPNLSREQIAEKLKIINSKLTKYQFVNRQNIEQWSVFIEQKNDLKKRHEELKLNFTEINEFIRSLDEKKIEKMNLTFNLIQTEFEKYCDLLCDFKASLIKENNELIIKVKDCNSKGLSGGQKAMIAIALIFSIQKVDPSPFYIFDEIDANLDQASRIKLCNLFLNIKECQIIMTTFREETVNCGNLFIGVTYSDKKSYASEVERDIVYNFLSSN